MGKSVGNLQSNPSFTAYLGLTAAIIYSLNLWALKAVANLRSNLLGFVLIRVPNDPRCFAKFIYFFNLFNCVTLT